MVRNRYAPVSSSAVRQYELWPGRNLFLCEGRAMVSRDWGVVAFTITLTLTVGSLFTAISGPYLWRSVSPVVPVAGVMLVVLMLSFLLRTTFSDPGIIPRGEEAEALAGADRNSPAGHARVRQIRVDGIPMQSKYCYTCKIYRPPRASHCSTCDNCVDGFDHHCPWVGNCVGSRNYRYFYSFVFTTLFTCVYVAAFTLAHVIMLSHDRDTSVGDVFGDHPTTAFVLGMCSMVTVSVGSLTCFHTMLACANETTNDNIKHRFSTSRNPFSKGSGVENYCSAVFGPRIPSVLGLRRPVSDEELLLHNQRDCIM